MSTERETTRIVRSWLEEGRTSLPDWVRDDVLDRLPATPQRRSRWPAWRYFPVNAYAKVAIGVAAVAVVAVAGFNLLPRPIGPGGPVPSPTNTLTTPSTSPSPSPTPEPTASPVAHSMMPFAENPRAASMTFAFTAPPSWYAFGEAGVSIDGNGPDGDEASVLFYSGGRSLFSDPCLTVEAEAELDADIPVGPTVEDLVTALVDHPLINVTDPVDVTLAGYSGTYLDLTVPDDISECANYRPMDVGHHYAQGPGQRWHMWILDVDGTRVLVEGNDYPATASETLAEEQAIIESLVITP
jgi:hypothetical protein